MATFNPFMKRNEPWKKIAWAVALGIVFGFVSFALSGEGGSSLALGLLVAYIEFRLGSKQ